jgi:hypothetical protein
LAVISPSFGSNRASGVDCDTPPADGTVTWTSRAGQKYLTRPGSRLLFPALCLPAGELPTVPTAYRQPPGDRGVMMPTCRPREQDRAYRIEAERRHDRRARQAERRQRQAAYVGPIPPGDSDEPPPF